jgi:hypothetical protein
MAARLTVRQRHKAMTTFLAEFAATSNWTGACAKAGIARNLPNVWAEFDTDQFVGLMAEARLEGEDALRLEVRRRAIDGVTETKITRERQGLNADGTPILVVIKTETRIVRSNSILMRLAEAWLPEFKRDGAGDAAGDDDKIGLETLRGWIEDGEAAN